MTRPVAINIYEVRNVTIVDHENTAQDNATLGNNVVTSNEVLQNSHTDNQC